MREGFERMSEGPNRHSAFVVPLRHQSLKHRNGSVIGSLSFLNSRNAAFSVPVGLYSQREQAFRDDPGPVGVSARSGQDRLVR